MIDTLATRLQAADMQDRDVWCIFDNTTLGGATRNALELRSRVEMRVPAAVE